MAERKQVSKKIRFEVFKRDNFTCQYCGRKAPDVVLEVDHITPVAESGDNSIMNLITSCKDCNRGKGARKLDINTELEKQRKELEEINEKRNQLEMMAKWRGELKKIEESQIDWVSDEMASLTGARPNKTGRIKIKKWIKEFGVDIVIDATTLYCEQYAVDDGEKVISFIKPFEYIGGISKNLWNSRNAPNKAYETHLINKFAKILGYKREKKWRIANIINDSIKNKNDYDFMCSRADQVSNLDDIWELIEYLHERRADD